MCSKSEAEMWVGMAVDAELVRVNKVCRISVRGIQHLEQHLTLSECHATKRSVLRNKARLTCNRALVADDFFNGRAHERAVIDQPLPLPAISEHQEEAVPNQRLRRLVPRYQQGMASTDNLWLRQALRVRLRHHERAEQICARMLPPLD